MSDSDSADRSPSPEASANVDLRGPSTVADLVESGLSGQDAASRRMTKAATTKPVPHPSVEDRQRKGRLARAETPRERLSDWQPRADRRDPVELLVGQETSRVQELVPVRHARMATSAFAFYRGAALLMASDLAGLPRTSLDVQLCGDAHLSNFGLCAAPDRSVIFDVNDFDETNPGPFEWDVKRLATSFVLAGRDNGLPADVGLAARGGRRNLLSGVDGSLRHEGRVGDLVRPRRRDRLDGRRQGVLSREWARSGEARGQSGGDYPDGRRQGAPSRCVVGHREDHGGRGRASSLP